ncbi:MAG TPA: DUF1801 domain-containing protein [Candidatus Woesebacteria bacterium]|nr:DUF1801 domain-containing protein [Candidatus Woesebacteria bacterium]
MQSSAKTVTEYIESLPLDRKEAITIIRDTILKRLPKGYEETMQYGMIGYVVPLSTYPNGYLDRKNEPILYIALASQKNHIAVYLSNIYSDKNLEEKFISEFKATGKKLDMGKSCVRFKKLEDVPLDVIGNAVAATSVGEYIKIYESRKLK